jgi:hypothetical protein
MLPPIGRDWKNSFWFTKQQVDEMNMPYNLKSKVLAPYTVPTFPSYIKSAMELLFLRRGSCITDANDITGCIFGLISSRSRNN